MASKQSTLKAKDLEKKLATSDVHACDVMTAKDWEIAEEIRERYKDFLSNCKTEREAARYLVDAAEKKGFTDVAEGAKGGKYFTLYKNKVAAFAVPGKVSVEQGVNMIITHLDSPRLDLKQKPLYEDCNIAMGKTHYYGGIKKYQWVTRPLALHGVAITEKGKKVEITIGEKASDPVFTVLDLLPHLSHKAQYGKKIEEAILGEKLNIVLGGLPYGEKKDKRRFKLTVLNILNEKYGLVEQDLVSAELEVVPAGPARDVGLDRAFIGAYGQDDRVCSYAGVEALFHSKPAKRAQVVICVDKEEIGSYGNTGAYARVVLDFLGSLLELEGKTDERSIRRAMANSNVLSGDVSAAVNPDWQEVHEKNNAAFAGQGIVMTKFTGSKGKSGANDANAEFIGLMRSLWNKHKVVWQYAELGKVDEGGGGTVALYLARHGAEVMDAGTGVLAMHSPFELVHVADFYMTFKAYKVFLDHM